MRFVCRVAFWLGCLTLLAETASAQTNGIFADFTTTLGSFTCQLDYSNSPMAVANFIGLATGERSWLDLVSGRARTNAFYEGLTFHRVISGFMIQGGSPNGNGTDGPGYTFEDHFSSALNFNGPWMLAMANSGPDSNGSQFFVTVAPYVPGNNTYVIFGRVVSGTNVVAAINHVVTDSNDKPVTNVVIRQVAIRRVGTAAQAFDINAHGLPIVRNLPIQIGQSNGTLSLVFPNSAYADNRLYSSTNLSFWSGSSLGIEVTLPTSNTVPIVVDSSEKFYQFAQVQYASSTYAPKNVFGRTLTMAFAAGQGTNTIVFNSSGGGTYTFAGVNSGTLTSYTWSQTAYAGYLWPIQYSGLNQMTLQLNFTGSTNGSFSGTVYGVPPFAVSGTFKLVGP
jgi:peptidyl-prolyl cis-trans isomerase A (cyclophilin A)